MTTITQDINDLAGVDDNTSWTFYTEQIRLSSTGTAVVSTKKIRKYPVAGVLTVVLDPGPAVVIAPDGNKYPFTVPGANSDLWTLIQAAATIPPTTRHQELLDAVAAWLVSHPPSAGPTGPTGAAGASVNGVTVDGSGAFQFYANGSAIGTPLTVAIDGGSAATSASPSGLATLDGGTP